MPGASSAATIAAASARSFLTAWRLRYARTNSAAINRGSKPSACIVRPQQCAPPHASMPTTVPRGSVANQARNPARLNSRVSLTRPTASATHTTNTFFARSTPTVVAFIWTSPFALPD